MLLQYYVVRVLCCYVTMLLQYYVFRVLCCYVTMLLQCYVIRVLCCYVTMLLQCYVSNHSIFRHDNFIGCFSADKIKMSARKYFCFNIPVHYCPVKVDK